MRKFKFFITSLAVFLAVVANGQDQKGKWFLGLGAYGLNYKVKEMSVDQTIKQDADKLGIKNWAIVPALSEITVGQKFMDYLAWDARASMGEVANHHLENAKNQLYLNFGAGIRAFYELDFWEPYARLGLAYHRFNYKGTKADASKDKNNKEVKDVKGGNNSMLVQGGLGMNFWLGESQQFGINLEGNYNWNPLVKIEGGKSFGGPADHIAVSAGVVVRFGGAQNGLTAKQAQAIETLEGCPDSSNCAYPSKNELNSVSSKVDAVETRVEKSERDIEEVKSTPVAVPVVPAMDDKIIDEINVSFKKISFEKGSNQLSKASLAIIKKAAPIINNTPTVLHLNGYANDTPFRNKLKAESDKLNGKLAKNRAIAVLEALESLGVEKGKLKVNGCGISTYHSNKDDNRRVEISLEPCDKK